MNSPCTRKCLAGGLLLVIIVNLARLAVPADTATGSDRTRYQKLYDDGNYKDAYDGFRKLVLDRKDDPTLVAGDLNKALGALRNWAAWTKSTHCVRPPLISMRVTGGC